MSKKQSIYVVLPVQGAPEPWRFAVITPSMTMTNPDPNIPDVPVWAVHSFHPDTLSAYNAAVALMQQSEPKPRLMDDPKVRRTYGIDR